MRSLTQAFLEAQPISQGLLQTIRLLGEFKGKQALFREQSPQVLETLRQSSVIESTESSNRLEGITAPRERVANLVRQSDTPRNRPEQEIAGYRDVLQRIHEDRAGDFGVDGVLQFHHALYQYSSGTGGRWKALDNEITETLPDGVKRLRFRPVPASETPESMRALHDRFERLWAEGNIEPLLLIPAYILDFLCIHPFLDGNGRTARLLTLQLLERSGYEVGRFISLERVVEETKEGYYRSLYLSSQNWHEARHSLVPWWEYFLGVMLLGAYREFADRVGAIQVNRGVKREMLHDVVARLPEEFRVDDLKRACPGVSRPTINRALAELRKAGQIVCVRGGRDAVWKKLEAN